MNPMTEVRFDTPYGEKLLAVHCGDIIEFGKPLDVMTISAFYRSYNPSPRTLIRALYHMGIDVKWLSQRPIIDLRTLCNIWLSDEVAGAQIPIRRIGCIEMSPYRPDLTGWQDHEGQILNSIHAYFSMLDLACASGIRVETLGLPVLGGGYQQISLELVSIPMINECIGYLQRSSMTREIHIITRNAPQAYEFAQRLNGSYAVAQQQVRQKQQDQQKMTSAVDALSGRLAFISYSSQDKNIADNLCAKLEAAGIRAWYAPRDIVASDFASSIVRAIERCTDFVVILSKNSLASEHVLNEIDLAFQTIGKGTTFAPLKIDEEELGAAFKYYLSRQHWMDAHVPPLEQRLDEFVERLRAR